MFINYSSLKYSKFILAFQLQFGTYEAESEHFLMGKRKILFQQVVFQISRPTLYKLSAVPVRICITHESYHQYPWVISSVPVSHILSTREGMQYPWVISSVLVRICSTCESYPQYLWRYAVPMSHVLSTRESYPQYPWGYAVLMSHIGQFRRSFRNKVSQACPKNTRMIQNLNLLAGHLRQSLTLTVLKGPKLKTKYQPAL